MSRHAQSALRLFQSAFKIITICIIVVIIITDFLFNFGQNMYK